MSHKRLEDIRARRTQASEARASRLASLVATPLPAPALINDEPIPITKPVVVQKATSKNIADLVSEQREHRDQREPREPRDQRDSRNQRDSRDLRDQREPTSILKSSRNVGPKPSAPVQPPPKPQSRYEDEEEEDEDVEEVEEVESESEPSEQDDYSQEEEEEDNRSEVSYKSTSSYASTPATSKPKSSKASSQPPAPVETPLPPPQASQKVEKTRGARTKAPASRKREEEQTPVEVDENAEEGRLPKRSMMLLLKSTGVQSIATDVFLTAEEILEDIIVQVLSQSPVVSGSNVHELINQHFKNGDNDLPENTIIPSSKFNRFLQPLLEKYQAAFKRDGGYLFHLFCEAYLCKMMQAADLIASSHKRSRVQGADLTVAYHIYNM